MTGGETACQKTVSLSGAQPHGKHLRHAQRQALNPLHKISAQENCLKIVRLPLEFGF